MNVAKISVSIPRHLIAALDDMARKTSRSRSNYLTMLLEAHLKSAQKQAIHDP